MGQEHLHTTSPLPFRSASALRFELAGPAGADPWLDIGDIKFY
jgi:hypothetical protein